MGSLISLLGSVGSLGTLMKLALAEQAQMDRLHALAVGGVATIDLPDDKHLRFKTKGAAGKKRFRVRGVVVDREPDAP